MFIKMIYYTGDAELLYPTKTSGRSGNRTAKVRKKCTHQEIQAWYRKN